MQSPLEVLDQVFRDQANPLLAADERFQRGPLGRELQLAIHFFPLGEVLEHSRVDLPKDCERWVKSGTDGLTRDRFLRIRPQAWGIGGGKGPPPPQKSFGPRTILSRSGGGRLEVGR